MWGAEFAVSGFESSLDERYLQRDIERFGRILEMTVTCWRCEPIGSTHRGNPGEAPIIFLHHDLRGRSA